MFCQKSYASFIALFGSFVFAFLSSTYGQDRAIDKKPAAECASRIDGGQRSIR